MWMDRASQEAKDIMKYYLDDIVDNMVTSTCLDLRDNQLDSKLNTHLNENYNYKEFTFQESCEILEELEDFEETDKGVFMAKNDMKQSFKKCAVYTYQNVVKDQIGELVTKINSDFDIQEMAETENKKGLKNLLEKFLS